MTEHNQNVFFIVGNSRSGTTMMLRMLSNHPKIYGLNELHFFEQLWSSSDKNKKLSPQEASVLADKLLFVQRDGYIGKTKSGKYADESDMIVESATEEGLYGQNVFMAMMQYETKLNGKSLPCEKTPQNVFYLKEILELYPHARIINMVRDPRAVMLSQKRKWRRRKMGATFITPWEVLRLRINYHPITLSKLWNAAITAALPFEKDDRMLTVHFENVLNEPENTARKICDHLGVDFVSHVLDIPQASSSNEADSAALGVDKQRAGNWKKGGLNDSEIYWCQKISGELMVSSGYPIEDVKASLLKRWFYAISFPFKLILALLINLNRMKNIGETLKKRLVSK